jgi:hypothetical protein
LEERLNPQISRPQRDETPKVTLDRTRELLARSRATLDVANRQLGHRDHEAELIVPPGSDPPTDPTYP